MPVRQRPAIAGMRCACARRDAVLCEECQQCALCCTCWQWWLPEHYAVAEEPAPDNKDEGSLPLLDGNALARARLEAKWAAQNAPLVEVGWRLLRGVEPGS